MESIPLINKESKSEPIRKDILWGLGLGAASTIASCVVGAVFKICDIGSDDAPYYIWGFSGVFTCFTIKEGFNLYYDLMRVQEKNEAINATTDKVYRSLNNGLQEKFSNIILNLTVSPKQAFEKFTESLQKQIQNKEQPLDDGRLKKVKDELNQTKEQIKSLQQELNTANETTKTLKIELNTTKQEIQNLKQELNTANETAKTLKIELEEKNEKIKNSKTLFNKKIKTQNEIIESAQLQNKETSTWGKAIAENVQIAVTGNFTVEDFSFDKPDEKHPSYSLIKTINLLIKKIYEWKESGSSVPTTPSTTNTTMESTHTTPETTPETTPMSTPTTTPGSTPRSTPTKHKKRVSFALTPVTSPNNLEKDPIKALDYLE